MSGLLRYASRFGAFAIVLLLCAVWTMSALESLTRPLFDIGRPAVGDMIINFAGYFSLSPQSTLLFALLLVCLKLMVGAVLLSALFIAAYMWVLHRAADDAMLDVALFIAAVASAASALPGLMHGGEMLNQVIGELMLCMIASTLAIYGRGYLVPDEHPAPVRVEPTGLSTR